MANHVHNTPEVCLQPGQQSRRSMFGAAAALALASPAVAADFRHLLPAPAVVPLTCPGADDRHLLDLGNRFADLYAREQAAWALAILEHEDDGPLTTCATALTDQCEELAGRIQPLQAATIAGLAVKVRADRMGPAGRGLTPGPVV